MLPKYTVEYSVQFKKHAQTYHYSSDDPVACEEFLAELLDRGFKLVGVRHEGVDLSQTDSDRMIKTAGGLLASKHIRAALGISAEEEHHRFGFAA